MKSGASKLAGRKRRSGVLAQSDLDAKDGGKKKRTTKTGV